MNVFFATRTSGGCAKWRTDIPAKYLRKRGHTVQFLGNTSTATFPDAIVFARTYQADIMRLFNWCKERGVLVVYDTDDALDLVEPWNPAYHGVRSKQDDADYMLRNADIVTTTTPTLAAHLRQWNPNVAVLPNSIDPEEWQVRPREAGRRVRVGWTGGSTHFLDLAVVLDAVSELQRRLQFEFVLMGLTNEVSVQALYQRGVKLAGKKFRSSPLGRSIKVFLDKSERLQYEFHPFVKTSAYVDAVCDLRLDIGIAPLADTLFNRHKSCIKHYEYSLSGGVTLASDVLPYSLEVPNVCRNTRDIWKDRLEALIDSDRSQSWAEQHDWVMTHRNMQRNVVMWEEVLTRSEVSVA
jgi:hypothetical protein